MRQSRRDWEEAWAALACDFQYRPNQFSKNDQAFGTTSKSRYFGWSARMLAYGQHPKNHFQRCLSVAAESANGMVTKLSRKGGGGGFYEATEQW